MNKRIKELLDTNDKQWHDANNDLLLLSLLIEMHVNHQKINDPFYREMLDDELYNYKMTNEEYEEILSNLINLIKQDSSFSPTIAGILCESNEHEIFLFLIDQLKSKYLLDVSLTSSIIKSININYLYENEELLNEIINNSSDENLKTEAKELLTFILENPL